MWVRSLDWEDHLENPLGRGAWQTTAHKATKSWTPLSIHAQKQKSNKHGFDPWVGKIPLGRKWQPTSGFLPGKSHAQRSLVGTARALDMTEHNFKQSKYLSR